MSCIRCQLLELELKELKDKFELFKKPFTKDSNEQSKLCKTLSLTPSQAVILLMLYNRAGTLVPALMIHESITKKASTYQEDITNLIQVQMSKLRTRLKKIYPNTKFVYNIWSKGYGITTDGYNIVKEILNAKVDC